MDDEFLLITQNNHAMLSGELGAFFGNDRFSPPEPADQTLAAVALHDCGWPLHDERPTLNINGLPVDVFENPLPLSLRMWTESAERAAQASPCTQLLVSLHVFGLSAFAAASPRTAREMFELNQFQHQEIERQEHLRRELGLRTDIPLRFGLALNDEIPEEAQLRHNYNIIQILDRLSLALCCTEVRFPRIEAVTPRPGPGRITLLVRRPTPTELRVTPWPFNRPTISLGIPYRAVPARKYKSEEHFQAAYAAAPVNHLDVTVMPD